MANLLGIDIVGSSIKNKIHEDVIYRLSQRPLTLPNYRFLVATENVEELTSASVPNILVVRDLRVVRSFIEKKNYKGKIGLEIQISPMRNVEGKEVGKWFKEITELYRFSERYDFQFIISSGAKTIWEMISRRCLESVLKLCDINAQTYWEDLEHWIDLNTKPRVA